MKIEIIMGVYAVAVFIATAFFSWIARKDTERVRNVDFYLLLIVSAALAWPLALLLAAYFFIVNVVKRLVSHV